MSASTRPRRFPHWRRCLAGGLLCLTLAAGSGTVAAAPMNGVGPVPVNMQGNAGGTTTIQNPGVVSWVHFGDLHITTGDAQNYQDFQQIIANTNQYLKNGVNFAVLPGDNANDDTESEYQLIKQATDQLQVPLYAIPGDHDLKSGLTNYFTYLEPVDYQSFTADQYHFVFLDVMSGISQDEKTWLTNDLDAAAKAGLKSVLFMHSYNLASGLQDIIQRDNVIVVDSGHTHYNDVANDGHTIYSATRSTGQVTEGPVGFSLFNLDNGVVSWKFKQLGAWPFAMITSPSDEQLMIDGHQVVHGATDIRAKVWDDKGVASATMSIDNGTPMPMTQIGTSQMWSVPWDSTTVSDGEHQLTLNVTGAGGNTTEDKITVLVNQSGNAQLPQRSFGVTGNSLGAYAEKGLLGNHTAMGGGKGAPGGKNAPACQPTTNTTMPAPASATPAPNGAATANAPTTPANCAPAGGNTPAPANGQGGGKGGPKGQAGVNPSGANAAPGAPNPAANGNPRPGPAPGMSGTGGKGRGAATVTAVNGNQVTVKYADGTTQTVALGSNTQIIREVAGSASDLMPGQAVAIGGVNGTGTGQTAATIEIPLPTAAPQAPPAMPPVNAPAPASTPVTPSATPPANP